MARHSGPLLCEVAVAEQRTYGDWIVKSRFEDSKRKVVAECTSCGNEHVVDIYELNRKTRKNHRCKGCSNQITIANNRQPPGVALKKQVFHDYKKNAKQRGIEWQLDFDSFTYLINSPCRYCGQLPSRIVESAWDRIYVNGIDRINNIFGYTVENTASCCKFCNYAKRDLSEQEFIRTCKMVSEHYSRNNRT